MSDDVEQQEQEARSGEQDLLPPATPQPQTPVPPRTARSSRPHLMTPRGTVVHTLNGHIIADYAQLRATRLQGPLFDLDGEPGWLPDALGLLPKEGQAEHPGCTQLRQYLECQGVTTGRQFVAQFDDKTQEFKNVISSIWEEDSVVEALTSDEWKTIIDAKAPPPLDTKHVREMPDGRKEVHYKHVMPHVPAKKLRTAVQSLSRQAKANVKTASRDDDLDTWLQELDPTMSLIEELSQPLREKLGVVCKSDLTDPTLSELKNIKKLFEEREAPQLPGSLPDGRRDGRKRLPPIVGQNLKPAPKNDFLRAVMKARSAHKNGSGASRRLELSGGDCTAQIWRAVSDLSAKDAVQFEPYDGVRARFSFRVPAEFIVPHTAKQVAEIFDEYDTDESGTLESNELTQLLGHLGLPYDEESVKSVLDEEVSNRNGSRSTRSTTVSKREFLHWWGQEKVGKYWDACEAKAAENKVDGPANLSVDSLTQLLNDHVPELVYTGDDASSSDQQRVMDDIHATLVHRRIGSKEAFIRWWIHDKTSGKSIGELFDMYDVDFSRSLDISEARSLLHDVLKKRHSAEDALKMLHETGAQLDCGITRNTFVGWWAKTRAHAGLCTMSNSAEGAWLTIDREGNGTVELFAHCCKKHHLESREYESQVRFKTGVSESCRLSASIAHDDAGVLVH